MIGRDLNIILQIEFLFSPVKFRYGEIVAAWVKKRPSAPGDFRCQDVQKFLKGKVRLVGCVHSTVPITPEQYGSMRMFQISDFKIPEHVIFVDDFPKTASGKVQKFVMAEETKQMLTMPDMPWY